MTAVSSLAATVLTPLNFAFYGWLNPHTREYLTQISLDPTGILVIVLLVGLPHLMDGPGLAVVGRMVLDGTLQTFRELGELAGSAWAAGNSVLN